MSSISLMDIIGMEYSIGVKILTKNKAITTKCINNTCIVFNEITKREIEKHRDEYYRWFLPKNIEDTIEKKMFAYLKHPHNPIVYKKPEEYENDLRVFASHINENNGDCIFEKMLNLYQYNVREYYICDNITSTRYIFGVLMKEFYNFIKYHMKREIKREEFDKEDEDTNYMIMRYKKDLS